MAKSKQQLLADLDASRRRLVETVRALTPAQLETPSPNEGWTVKDTLGHVCAAEGGMLVLVERGLKGESAVVPDFDINRFNAGQVRRSKDKSVGDLLAQLDESRRKLLAMVEPLGDDDLARPAHHPVAGPTTVGGILGIIAWHEGTHTDDIAKVVGG